MFRRKLEEIGSAVYRTFCYPFVRMGIERRTKSILKPKSYLIRSSLRGRNYLGKNVYLKNTILGFGSYINDNGNFTNTWIGNYTSIGTDVKAVLGSHPVHGHVAMHPAFYAKSGAMGFTYAKEDTFEEFCVVKGKEPYQIVIGNDVWIGNDVKIMQGVTIGDGAVVGAGAVVTKDIPPYSICAGVPARVKGYRFEPGEIEMLLALKWWDKEETFLKEHIQEFSDIGSFLKGEKERRQHETGNCSRGL